MEHFSIYVAATFARKIEATLLADYLTKCGHRVVSTWLQQEPVNGNAPKSPSEQKLSEEYGKRDVSEVSEAQVLVMLTGDSKDIPPTGGGRHVEFGLARAMKKFIILLGPRENVFHQAPEVISVNNYLELRLCLDSVGSWQQIWEDAH